MGSFPNGIIKNNNNSNNKKEIDNFGAELKSTKLIINCGFNDFSYIYF